MRAEFLIICILTRKNTVVVNVETTFQIKRVCDYELDGKFASLLILGTCKSLGSPVTTDLPINTDLKIEKQFLYIMFYYYTIILLS